MAAVPPLLYAILNSAMAYYARQNGVPVVLSELSQVQLKNSDIATTAGYISMMIPPLSWAMIKSMGAGFSSAYSHFASSGLSSTSRASSSVVDGNYSLPICKWRTSAATAGVPTVRPASVRCRGSWGTVARRRRPGTGRLSGMRAVLSYRLISMSAGNWPVPINRWPARQMCRHRVPCMATTAA